MNVFLSTDHYEKPIVLALGFFDCVHLGHLALINEAKKMAGKVGGETAISTFGNDPNSLLNKKAQVYSIEERKIVFKNQGIDNVICEYFTKEFAEQTPRQYLDSLCHRFNIVGVVAGRDYSFGKGAEGNVCLLKEYFAEKNVKVKIVPFEKANTKKISTRYIKKFLEDGDIQVANSLLTQPYFIVGEVVHARHRGTIIGFPTANIEEHSNTTMLATGIYATKVYLEGKSYIGITNVGPKPTFGENNHTIETHILDFSKDIYGKTIQVEFHKKLREVIKFTSVPALCNQMKIDEKEAREFFNKSSI